MSRRMSRTSKMIFRTCLEVYREGCLEGYIERLEGCIEGRLRMSVVVPKSVRVVQICCQGQEDVALLRS